MNRADPPAFQMIREDPANEIIPPGRQNPSGHMFK